MALDAPGRSSLGAYILGLDARAHAAESATLSASTDPLPAPLTGEHIDITLIGATWVEGTAFADIRADIRDGLTGSLSGVGTWDEEKSHIPVLAVTRHSATVVRIALDELEGELTRDDAETITSGAVAAAWTDSAAPITVDGSVVIAEPVPSFLEFISSSATSDRSHSLRLTGASPCGWTTGTGVHDDVIGHEAWRLRIPSLTSFPDDPGVLLGLWRRDDKPEIVMDLRDRTVRLCLTADRYVRHDGNVRVDISDGFDTWRLWNHTAVVRLSFGEIRVEAFWNPQIDIPFRDDDAPGLVTYTLIAPGQSAFDD